MVILILMLVNCPQVFSGEPTETAFLDEVVPIIQRRCAQCHTGSEAEGGLRLDRTSGWAKGGDSGLPAIVPSEPGESELLRRVRSDDESEQMPPEGARLSAEEIATLTEWIQDGGKIPTSADLNTLMKPTSDHWSLQPIRRPEIPVCSDRWARNPIDAFVLERLAEQGLTPSPVASPRTLLRRISLDMLGLPPTLDQVGRFEQNSDAWSDIVDQVLASPHYGERWARHWLDVVRFGETHGFETNRERPHAWRYRDYVIRSLNEDVPYDRFVREQIAGDHLEQPLGTAFLVAGPYDLVKSPDINLTLMQRQNELDDIVNTTGTTFLGLTLGCARCHNHKFDPVTQSDYYSLQAVFAGVQHGDRSIPLSRDEQHRVAALTERIDWLDRRLEAFVRPMTSGIIVIHETDEVSSRERGFRLLRDRTGVGVNPAGQDRGHKDDPGDLDRSANISGGKYAWWQSTPGQFVAQYQPRVRGRFECWVSWGSGHQTHGQDVEYILDADGDLKTTDDQTPLVTIDQRLDSRGRDYKTPGAYWSGFRTVGVIELTPASVIAIRAGNVGTAVTADALVLRAIDPASSVDTKPDSLHADPRLRPPVNSVKNVDTIGGLPARWLRFTIQKTNASQPCLDELEVWSAGENRALARSGTQAKSSSDLPGYEIHKLAHINDGRHGNDFSWISNENSGGWVQLEFPDVIQVDHVIWGRDRTGRFRDRTAIEYRIELATEPGVWTEVANSTNRLPKSSPTTKQIGYAFDDSNTSRAQAGRRWLAERTKLDDEKRKLQTENVAYVGKFQQPSATHRLYRGDPKAPREQVAPDTVRVLGRLGLAEDTPEKDRRVTLAKWLTRSDNPLVARVIVNRVWAYHFGIGIVATPNDFGVNGARPTHPLLLDWLASELIRSEWSIKHIHRLILNSATYRQQGLPRADAQRIDAGSLYLWRFPPRRLEAEVIRDSVLMVAGTLDTRMQGPGFSAFRVDQENVRHYFPKESYGPSDWRRMIYMTKVRQEQDSVFGVFDCPDGSQAVPRRSRSTTPLQALNMFNSTFMMQQADQLATLAKQSEPQNSDHQIRLAFQRVLVRNPTEDEFRTARQFVADHGLVALCRALLNSNEFLFLP